MAHQRTRLRSRKRTCCHQEDGAVPMSRFVVITCDADFERRARHAATGLRGTLHVITADYLPPSPEDILRVLTGEIAEVILLGPGLPLEDSIRLASLFDL